MTDNGNNEPREGQQMNEDQPGFRLNAKVFQMLMLVLIALILPTVVAILGIQQMRQSDIKTTPQGAEELPELRSSLEAVAEKAWGPSDLTAGGFRVLVLECKDGDTCLQIGESIKEAANRLGGVVLSPERIEAGGTRWIIQVPQEAESDFNAALLRLGFLLPPMDPLSAEKDKGKSILYQINLPIRQ
jgi:hypothetical protein